MRTNKQRSTTSIKRMYGNHEQFNGMRRFYHKIFQDRINSIKYQPQITSKLRSGSLRIFLHQKYIIQKQQHSTQKLMKAITINSNKQNIKNSSYPNYNIKDMIKKIHSKDQWTRLFRATKTINYKKYQKTKQQYRKSEVLYDNQMLSKSIKIDKNLQNQQNKKDNQSKKQRCQSACIKFHLKGLTNKLNNNKKTVHQNAYNGIFFTSLKNKDLNQEVKDNELSLEYNSEEILEPMNSQKIKVKQQKNQNYINQNRQITSLSKNQQQISLKAISSKTLKVNILECSFQRLIPKKHEQKIVKDVKVKQKLLLKKKKQFKQNFKINTNLRTMNKSFEGNSLNPNRNINFSFNRHIQLNASLNKQQKYIFY